MENKKEKSKSLLLEYEHLFLTMNFFMSKYFSSSKNYYMLNLQGVQLHVIYYK